MSDCPARNPRLAWREIGGEIVIISPDDSQVHELNETASAIWRQADGTKTWDEIAVRVVAEFEVELNEARADVAQLAAVLSEKRLLLEADSGKG
jgi:Coenzyme PQQ synthesis protein D (PqqD)